MFKEAEARGAAEDPAKGVEEWELVYQIKLKGGNGSWQDVDFESYQEFSEPHWLRRTLYTRTANVAALEARVKELEAVLDGIKTYAGDTLAGPVGGSGDLSWFRGGVEETFRRTRAALTREGGCNGD